MSDRETLEKEKNDCALHSNSKTTYFIDNDCHSPFLQIVSSKLVNLQIDLLSKEPMDLSCLLEKFKN